ncbi:MAG: alanine dehydrogenase [Actinomycetota bacterium]|nr:alanine dehydrogenase [Actinomycetota bacterium]
MATEVGVPTETKADESRVALTPAAVQELVSREHKVTVQSGAGEGAGFQDELYKAAGAQIVTSADDVFDVAELLIKVKEPTAAERSLLRPTHTLFTYLHLAADRAQGEDLLASGATCLAYETVTDADSGLPLLTPMSAIAGRMSIQAGARCLEAPHGGTGVLLGGVPGVRPGRVVIIGGGVVGRNAAEMAVGLGAEVTVLDRDPKILDALDQRFDSRIRTVFSTAADLEVEVLDADLVVGAVLLPGARTPRLVTTTMVSSMKPGSVIVDVAIDQGGCIETSRPTTHSDPTFISEGVVHYGVTNMPGAVPRTATLALANATLPYVLFLADRGVDNALRSNAHLLSGLNVCAGRICEPAVAEALGVEVTDPLDALGAR